MIKLFLLFTSLIYSNAKAEVFLGITKATQAASASSSSSSGLGGAYYLLGQGGYFSLRQTAALAKNVTPSAFTKGGGLGWSGNWIEFEASYIAVEAEGAIIHDGVNNFFVHKESFYTLALNCYLFPMFYLRGGYSYHDINQTLKYPVSASSQAGAVTEYNLQGKTKSKGYNYGAGLLLYRSAAGMLTSFVQIEKLKFSTFDSGAWNTSVGFRFYFK